MIRLKPTTEIDESLMRRYGAILPSELPLCIDKSRTPHLNEDLEYRFVSLHWPAPDDVVPKGKLQGAFFIGEGERTALALLVSRPGKESSLSKRLEKGV
jgi:hypothetical protein